MAVRSPTPQSPPSAQMLSYSGPSPLWPPAVVRRAQPMTQPRQAARFCTWSRLSISPEIWPACSNWLSRKLRVGKAPAWFSTLTSTEVPKSGSACEVIGLALMSFSASYTMNSRRCGSATAGRWVPCPATTTALSFLAPITVPRPPRPMERPRLLTMDAKSTPRSPVGPVSYTHLRAHETRHDLVCRLLLETQKQKRKQSVTL